MKKINYNLSRLSAIEDDADTDPLATNTTTKLAMTVPQSQTTASDDYGGNFG